jgi:hypothetical protein
MEALASVIGRLHMTRTISEEFAETELAVNSTETDGDTDCIVRNQTIRRTASPFNRSFPTEVFEDNAIVVKIAKGDGRGKLGRMRSALRLIGAIHRGIHDKIIDVVQIDTLDNASNHMSKLTYSPLKHAKGLEGVVGKSQEMVEYKAIVIGKFGKKLHPIVNSSSSTEQNYLAFAALPDWTKSTSAHVLQLLKNKGLYAAQFNQSYEVYSNNSSHEKNLSGIGFVVGKQSSSERHTSTNEDHPMSYNFIKPSYLLTYVLTYVRHSLLSANI